MTRSSTLQVTWVFVLSGLGFAGSNLVFARAMESAEYGVFALVLALIQIAVPVGPGGVDILVNRHRLQPDIRLLGRVTVTAALLSGGLTFLGAFWYSLAFLPVGLLFLSGVAGATNWVAAAHYQSRQRFDVSLALSQNQNLVLVIAALITLGSASRPAWLPLVVVTVGYTVSTMIGWARILRGTRHGVLQGGTARVSWREGATVLGASGAELVMIQMDRLMIPTVLDVAELGRFAVLAATIGAPFRILQLAAGYSMVPRIRSARSVDERWSRLRSEAAQTFAVTLGGAAVIWAVVPFVVGWLVGDKYTLGGDVVLAAVVAGGAKVAGALATACVTAVGGRRQLLVLTYISWISVALGVVGAHLGAGWGLAGVVYGVAAGWVFRAFGAVLLVPSSLARTELLDG